MHKFPSEIPDSATIVIANYNIIQHDGSTLYIDNLSFDDLVTVPEQTAKGPLLSVYPNPAADEITIETSVNFDRVCLDLIDTFENWE
jgi:hypothetical protein